MIPYMVYLPESSNLEPQPLSSCENMVQIAFFAILPQGKDDSSTHIPDKLQVPPNSRAKKMESLTPP